MLQYPLRMRYNWKTLWGCVGQGRDCIDKCKFFTMVWNQLLSVGKCQTPNPWQANVKRSLGLISDITVIRDYLIVCASFSYLEWRSSIKLISHNGKPPKKWWFVKKRLYSSNNLERRKMMWCSCRLIPWHIITLTRLQGQTTNKCQENNPEKW